MARRWALRFRSSWHFGIEFQGIRSRQGLIGDIRLSGLLDGRELSMSAGPLSVTAAGVWGGFASGADASCKLEHPLNQYCQKVSAMNDKARGMPVCVSRKLAAKPARADPAINNVPIKALAVPARSGKRRMLFPKHCVKVIEPLMKTTAVGITRWDKERGIAEREPSMRRLARRAISVAISIKGILGNQAVRNRLARLPRNQATPRARATRPNKEIHVRPPARGKVPPR